MEDSQAVLRSPGIYSYIHFLGLTTLRAAIDLSLWFGVCIISAGVGTLSE